MVFDLKYHLATIIAIFLALALGILIGTAMVGQDGVANEQKTLIVEIENNLHILRSQNSQFRSKLTALEGTVSLQDKFIDQLLQDAISEKMSGSNCLLIPDKKHRDTTMLMQVLRSAGVTVTDFTALEKNLQANAILPRWDFCLLLGKDLPGELNTLFTREQIYHPSEKDLASKESIYQLFKSITSKLNIEKYRQEAVDKTTHTISTNPMTQTNQTNSVNQSNISTQTNQPGHIGLSTPANSTTQPGPSTQMNPEEPYAVGSNKLTEKNIHLNNGGNPAHKEGAANQ